MVSSTDALRINRAGWNHVAPRFYGGTALPEYGPMAPTEDVLQLLGSLRGARILEVGCGSGHSLRYAAEHGAGEIWGLDLSSAQIAFATDVLRDTQPAARLFESPMEENPGLPAGHFDLVFSIFGLGWTTDLPRTFGLIAEYLRPGGCFVFSGEHPIFACVTHDNGRFVVTQSYQDEGPRLHDSWSGVPIVIQYRKLSTFLNELVRAGLAIERLVESEVNPALATEYHADPARWYSTARAELVPTTFIVKACKPGNRQERQTYQV